MMHHVYKLNVTFVECYTSVWIAHAFRCTRVLGQAIHVVTHSFVLHV